MSEHSDVGSDPSIGEIEEFGVEGFSELPPAHRLVVMRHVRNPEMSKKALAIACGVSERHVHRLFMSEAYDKINRAFASEAMKQLRMLAVEKLRECLNSKNEAVKASVALSILRSDGLIKDAPKETFTKQHIAVSWGSALAGSAMAGSAMSPIDVTPRCGGG